LLSVAFLQKIAGWDRCVYTFRHQLVLQSLVFFIQLKQSASLHFPVTGSATLLRAHDYFVASQQRRALAIL